MIKDASAFGVIVRKSASQLRVDDDDDYWALSVNICETMIGHRKGRKTKYRATNVRNIWVPFFGGEEKRKRKKKKRKRERKRRRKKKNKKGEEKVDEDEEKKKKKEKKYKKRKKKMEKE